MSDRIPPEERWASACCEYLFHTWGAKCVCYACGRECEIVDLAVLYPGTMAPRFLETRDG